MAQNRISIKFNENDLKALEQRYGQELTQKALRITNIYTKRLQREATGMIKDAGHVDTGKLVESITQNVSIKGGIKDRVIQGEVNADTTYARFIHEGAMHDGDKIVPHFVPFKVAPSLLLWAKREGVIYQKRKDGKARKTTKKGDNWYFMSAKGKEYPIDIKDGGLKVKQEAVKYFEKPLEKLRPEYFDELLKMI